MDIAAMADGEILRPLHCDWCMGITTHTIKRSMPIKGENALEVLDVYNGEFGNLLKSIDSMCDDEDYVFVTYSCERCKIKWESKRDGQLEHYAIWTVGNWNAHHDIQWVGNMKIRKLDSTRRRK